MNLSPPESQKEVRGHEGEGSVLARWSDVTLISLLLLCAVLPYSNTLLNGFVYDDHKQVLNNAYIRNFHHLREIFSTTVWSFLGAYGLTNYYRPMMTFGFLICYQFFGPLAYGFHVANVVLNAAVVLVLFGVTRRMLASRTLAFASAAAFALHPIHTESVAWISAITDLEVTFFFLLAFWCFLELDRPGGWRSRLMQAGMAASFTLALLSKEQALTLPFLATVYEHFCRDDRRETAWTAKLWRYGPLWLFAFAYLAFRLRYFGALAPVLQKPELTWYKAFLSAIALSGQYLWKLIWPVRFCMFYVFYESKSWLDPRVLGGCVGLILMAALFVALWKRKPLISFGLLWLLATLAPVLNARWMAANVFTERYLYLPSVGFSWVLAWGLAGLWEKSSGRRAQQVSLAFAVILVAGLALLRITKRNRDWKSDTIIYSKTLEVFPEAYMIRNNLGADYWNNGRTDAAEREWVRALKDAPESPVILNNLGLAFTSKKRYPEALECIQKALKIRPNFTDAHLNLASAYNEMGQKELAEKEFATAVSLSPLDYRVRNKLGRFYFDAGRFREAEEQFSRSADAVPNLEAYVAVGDLYLRRGAREQAERAYKQATAFDPFNSQAHFGLGGLYMASGRNREAWEEYQAGLKTDPQNPEALEALRKLKTQPADAHPPKL